MDLYSIEGLESRLLETDLLKGLKSMERIKSLDRHNYLLHCIISASLINNESDLSKYVNISSDKLKKHLGRNYTIIIDNLVKIGAVQINKNYSAGNFSKSYRINPNWARPITPIKVPVMSKWFYNKLNQIIEERVEEIEKDDVLSKIIKHTKNLFLIDEPQAFLPPPDEVIKGRISIPNSTVKVNFVDYIPNPQKLFRYEEYRNGLLMLNSDSTSEELVGQSVFYDPIRAESGRIYHFTCSIPKLIRRGLRTKDLSLIYEIDMASAQPTILMLEWLRWLKSKDQLEDNKEAELCLKLVLSGGIYGYIQKHSDYFSDLNYSELKIKVLTTLNKKDYPCNERDELIRLFPLFMEFLRKIKAKYGHKKVSWLGQSTEAKIFIGTYKELDPKIFALPIHDCILSTEDNLNHIRGLLIEKVKEMYRGIIPEDENLNKVFKTSLISIDNNNIGNLNWARYIMEFGEERDYYLDEYDKVDYIALDML